MFSMHNNSNMNENANVNLHGQYLVLRHLCSLLKSSDSAEVLLSLRILTPLFDFPHALEMLIAPELPLFAVVENQLCRGLLLVGVGAVVIAIVSF
jgi:hypothetical protein